MGFMKATAKKITLESLQDEVSDLRRNVGMFISTESLEEYKNADEILEAYKNAVKSYPLCA